MKRHPLQQPSTIKTSFRTWLLRSQSQKKPNTPCQTTLSIASSPNKRASIKNTISTHITSDITHQQTNTQTRDYNDNTKRNHIRSLSKKLSQHHKPITLHIITIARLITARSLDYNPRHSPHIFRISATTHLTTAHTTDTSLTLHVPHLA